MAVTAVLVLAIGSTILIASRALPDAASATGATISATQTLEPLITELQYAISVDNRSATMIEFAVADRDANDVPEAIRYEWSGTAGDPITRAYNGAAAVALLADVRDFNLSYGLEIIATEIPQGNESDETSLASYYSTYYLHDYAIKDDEWYAEYFMPTLPADAIGWKVTRVVIYAKLDGPPDGEARIQLQRSTVANLPSGGVLEEKTLLESTLLWSYTRREFSFSSVENLSPEEGLCIVIKWIANGTACKVRGRDEDVTKPGIKFCKSTNRGASWSALSGQSSLFDVHGTVTTAGTPETQSTCYLDTVEVRLRATDDPQSAVQTAIKVLNRPEVTE